MFYLLYLHFADVAKDYPLLHLIQYQTVRVALAMATARRAASATASAPIGVTMGAASASRAPSRPISLRQASGSNATPRTVGRSRAHQPSVPWSLGYRFLDSQAAEKFRRQSITAKILTASGSTR